MELRTHIHNLHLHHKKTKVPNPITLGMLNNAKKFFSEGVTSIPSRTIYSLSQTFSSYNSLSPFFASSTL